MDSGDNLPLTRPDVIHVAAQRTEEIAAVRADVRITVRGAQFFSGRAALTRSREVAQLVSDLKSAGVSEGDIQLLRVSAEVGKFVAKTSSADYRLKVRCPELDRLGAILGVAAEQKTIHIEGIDWGYPDLTEHRTVWLDGCLADANARARRIAAALGVNLLGVHDFIETPLDSERITPGFRPRRVRSYLEEDGAILADMVPSYAHRTGEADTLWTGGHSKTVGLRVDVEYRVSGFTAGGGG
jgi:uncharacterized protein YggE